MVTHPDVLFPVRPEVAGAERWVPIELPEFVQKKVRDDGVKSRAKLMASSTDLLGC